MPIAKPGRKGLPTVIIACLCTLAVAMLVQNAVAQAPADSPQSAPVAKPAPPIENLHTAAPQILSGGEPHDDAAFSRLAELGVRTVVSVDGIRPKIEAAKKHGLRYIHIPIGYDGVDAEAQAALTRVVKEAKGPIFFHCHHGKHRGPAATAVACLAAGKMNHPQALAFLKVAGTGAEYKGLWRDVREFKPLPKGAKLPRLVEAQSADTLAAAMAQLDRAWDGVKLCQAAGWTTPKDHADLAPPHEALLVWEALRESRRKLAGDDAYADPQLAEWLDAAVADAAQLRQSLEAKRPGTATKAYKSLENACTRCHVQYRN